MSKHEKEVNWTITLWMSFFLGWLGADRFIMGKIGTGILKLITVGGLGIWYLIDLILIMSSYKFKNVEWKFPKNKTIHIVIICILILGLVVGSSENDTTTSNNQVNGQQTQPTLTPTKIAEDWVKALIKGAGSEQVFNYLHQDIKSHYASYDEWNDELANIKHAWISQGVYFEYVGVQNEAIINDTASVEVKYRSKGVYQKTTTEKYEFLKINNEWKLKKYYDLDI